MTLHRIAFTLLFAVTGCVSAAPAPAGSDQLAADQTLRVPIRDDIATFDPAHTSFQRRCSLTSDRNRGMESPRRVA